MQTRTKIITAIAATWMGLGVPLQADDAPSRLEGDIRMLYLDHTAEEATRATGLGLNAAVWQPCYFTDALVWEAGVGLGGMISEASPADAARLGMASAGESAGDDSEPYAVISRLNGMLDYGDGYVKAGYQILETPLADRHDIRLTPNSFLAAVAGYEFERFTLVGGYVAEMAGADSNSSDPFEYHSMSEAALGSGVEKRGVAMAGILVGDMERAGNFQVWMYHMPSAHDEVGDVHAFYADGGLALENVDLAAQYMTFDNDIWFNAVMGARLTAAMGDMEMTIAMNSYSMAMHDSTAAQALGFGEAPAPLWYRWGGKPEFVGGEEVDGRYADWGGESAIGVSGSGSNPADGNGGNAYMASLLYQGIEELALSASVIQYSDRVNVLELMGEYTMTDDLALFVLAEHKQYDSGYASAQGLDDATILEGKLSYYF